MTNTQRSCDVCRVEGSDCAFNNGKKSKITVAKLYRIYRGKVAKVKLCHLHDIELFMLGEFRFLEQHLDLAMDISRNKAKYAASSNDF